MNRFFASKLKSVPGHKPPVTSENLHSRYSEVLFSYASKENKINLVEQDLENL